MNCTCTYHEAAVEARTLTYRFRYGSGDLKGMLFWNRRFDNALVAFLNCLQQIGDFAEQQDPKFRLPYRYDKHHTTYWQQTPDYAWQDQ